MTSYSSQTHDSRGINLMMKRLVRTSLREKSHSSTVNLDRSVMDKYSPSMRRIPMTSFEKMTGNERTGSLVQRNSTSVKGLTTN